MSFVRGWREAFLAASVITGLYIAAVTEILSLAGGLNRKWLIACWIPFICLGAWLILQTFLRKNLSFRIDWKNFPAIPAAMICIVLILVAVVALIAPPNTWDSMTYHMPRVRHWIENQSLVPYATHNTRQLYLEPWAEYAILHLQILTGSDRFANMVQWLSFAGCAIATSLVARLLGSSIQGQFLAALFTVTIPMGILQGSSTQNDLVVSFWLICFCFYSLRVLILKETGILAFAALFSALGLALLTKGTANIYAFPFITWLGLKRFRERGLGGFFPFLVGGLMILMLLSGHFTRNLAALGNLHGPVGRYMNWSFSIPSFGSNIARNLALHFVTPSDSLNHQVEATVVGFHRMIGLSASDPDTTYGNQQFQTPPSQLLAPETYARDNFEIIFHEDLAGNFIHTLLIFSISLTCLVFPAIRRNRDAFSCFLCCIAAFLLFCLLLRWQPWGSRLQLPLFVLWSPLFAIVSTILFSRTVRFNAGIFLFLMALPWLFLNSSRPLLGENNIFRTPRSEQYFINRSKVHQYKEAASVAGKLNCSQIGLIMNANSAEYPLWIYLDEKLNNSYRLKQIQVKNRSKKYDDGKFSLCAIISIDPPLQEVVHQNRVYREIYRSASLSVLN